MEIKIEANNEEYTELIVLELMQRPGIYSITLQEARVYLEPRSLEVRARIQYSIQICASFYIILNWNSFVFSRTSM